MCTDHIRKAKKGDPLGVIELLVRRQTEFARAVDRRWQTAMNPSVKRFRARVSTGQLTATKIDSAFRGMNRDALRFGRSALLEREIRDATRDSYVAGSAFIEQRDEQIRRRGKLPARPKAIRKAAGDGAIASFNVSLADEKAIKELGDTGVLWFRDVDGAPYFDQAAQRAIRDDALELIARGESAETVAKQLADKAEALFGTGKFADRGRTYWGGVAEHAATTAGIRGQLSQLVQLGWTRYEIINPMDERTTDVCQYMNGKTVHVSAGVAEVGAVAEQTDPDGVRDVKPFVPGGQSSAVTDVLGKGAPRAGEGAFTESQSEKLAQAGFATPPYHFRCRTFVDIAYVAGDPVPAFDPGRSGTSEERAALHEKETKAWIKDTYGNAGKFTETVPDGTFDAGKMEIALRKLPTQPNGVRTVNLLGLGGAEPPVLVAEEVEIRRQLSNLLAEFRIVSNDAITGTGVEGISAADFAAHPLSKIPKGKQAARPRSPFQNRFFSVDDANMPGALGTYAPDGGQIAVRASQHDRAFGYLANKAKGRPTTEAMANAMQTIVHEGLHGAGSRSVFNVVGFDPTPLGARLEEVTTELAARRIMAEKFGEKAFVRHDFQGSYQDWINDFRLAFDRTLTKKTSGFPRLVEAGDDEAVLQTVNDLVVDSSVRLKQVPLSEYVTRDIDMLDQFVHAVEWPEIALEGAASRTARVAELRTQLKTELERVIPK